MCLVFNVDSFNLILIKLMIIEKCICFFLIINKFICFVNMLYKKYLIIVIKLLECD